MSSAGGGRAAASGVAAPSELWELVGRAAGAPGLYVHVPFCATKCPYCDFYSLTDTEDLDRWVRALGREAAQHRGGFAPFDTLFLGGGTPSFLGEGNLAALLAALRDLFAFTPDAEITAETNPDDVNPALLATYRDLGINRISLGAQSFAPARLRFLERRHSAGDTRRALGLIREAGFENLSVDLIYGFVGQTPEEWRGCLDAALAFDPEHLSCYLLTLEPRTPFGKRHAQGRLPKLDEESERTLFLFTSAYLRERGYEHYEVSNFARTPALRSRHNQKYWRHTPYLGLGPSAHSFAGRRRWWNHRSLERYLREVERGQAPVDESEHLTDEQLRLELLYLGLRCSDGLPLALLGVVSGWEETAARLEAEGLVRRVAGRLTPTVDGFLLSDGLALRFER